jgi:hypothetical protein
LKLLFASFFEPNAIEMLVKAFWLDIHLKNWGDYRTGVRFADISPEDLNKLKNYLKSLHSP